MRSGIATIRDSRETPRAATEHSWPKERASASSSPPITVAVLDASGRITDLQGDLLSSDGIVTTGWLGHPITRFVAHPDRIALRGALSRAMTGRIQTVELRLLAASNDQRYWCHLTSAGPGRVTMVINPHLDTHQVRKRDSLSAEHMLHQGFDNSPVGMLLADPGAGGCLRVNDALCTFLGRSREQLLGGPITAVTPPENHPEIHRTREAVKVGTIEAYEGEQRFILPDGSSVWGLLHLTPIRQHSGRIEALYVQVIDITERKRREDRLNENLEDARWLGRLRAALDENRFLLYAQPIVDVRTAETVQHELLLRMRAEDGSIVPPSEFLPTAERYGLISEIDRWVTRQAVTIASQGIPTEFNLSARSLGDPTVLNELACAIQDTGTDPSLLVVEITETAVADDPEVAREFAVQVAALGCRLALDDFGTGFSSLSFLKHLPAEHLKIDIEFVRELITSDTDARVIRGIVGLAREFDQTTIAEGVEDEATLLQLRALGVDYAQGYLFGAPAPCGTFSEPDNPRLPG